MKRSSLQIRVSKFTLKKFCEIYPSANAILLNSILFINKLGRNTNWLLADWLASIHKTSYKPLTIISPKN